MAQGILKRRAPNPSSSKVSHSSKFGITKKGARTIAPKNKSLIKQQKMTKKLSGGLTAQTEKLLGERAGHLELLGQARKKVGTDMENGKGKPKEGWKSGKK